MKKLQVKLNNQWFYVFCRNELKQDPIATNNKNKAVDSNGLDYFQTKFANHVFRIV